MEKPTFEIAFYATSLNHHAAVTGITIKRKLLDWGEGGGGDGGMGRWGDGGMGRWGDGGMGRWGDGEMGRQGEI